MPPSQEPNWWVQRFTCRDTLRAGGAWTAALSALDAVVADTMERVGTPGLAVSGVHNDEVAYLKGFGVRDADSVFQLASLPKPTASTVVAGLVGDDVVGWDSRIAHLLSELKMHDPQAVREENPLRHYNRDVFLYQLSGENAYGPSAVAVAGDPQGRAASVAVDNLNVNGQGGFHRIA